MSKTNWIQRLKALLDAIKAVTDVLPDGGALTTLQAAADAIQAVTDNLPDAGALNDLAAILTDTDTTIPALLATIQADLDNPNQYKANVAALALEVTVADLITRVKGLNDIHDDAITNEALQATSRALLVTVAGYLDTEIAAILAAVDTEVASILTIVNNLPNAGALNDLATILSRVTAAVATAAALTAHNTALGTHDTDIKALLNTIAGYIDAEVAAILADVTGIAGAAMRGTDNAALAANWTAALATALGNYTAARAGYLDNLSAGAAALEATLTAIKGGGWSNETLVAIKAAIDAITGAVSTDWKGNFNWDTSVYATDETDISALFSTNLAEVTRRKYSVKLDLTAVEADGSFVELYLVVKEKIDGTNYRAIDRKTLTKANIAANAEPGIPIDIPATSENIQITMQMDTALAGDATIYYAVVKEHLE